MKFYQQMLKQVKSLGLQIPRLMPCSAESALHHSSVLLLQSSPQLSQCGLGLLQLLELPLCHLSSLATLLLTPQRYRLPGLAPAGAWDVLRSLLPLTLYSVYVHSSFMSFSYFSPQLRRNGNRTVFTPRGV